MKSKKGISPLIATVLLIGFTVALAAVIMTWGLDYIKKITSGTERTTEEQLKCARDLDFEIIPNCPNNQIEVDALKSKVDIAEMLLRIRYLDGLLVSVPYNQTIQMTQLVSIDISQYTSQPLTNAVSIDALASIKLRTGEIIPCSAAAKRDMSIVC